MLGWPKPDQKFQGSFYKSASNKIVLLQKYVMQLALNKQTGG